jgi:hypothetical protein
MTARSILQLMGAPPVSAAAQKNLPSPHMISPPRANIVIALGGVDEAVIASSMPKLQHLLKGQTKATVSHDARAEKGIVRRLQAPIRLCSSLHFIFMVERAFQGMKALSVTPYTACLSAVEVTLWPLFPCPTHFIL